MLCPSCRRQLERGASYCGSCGTPLNGSAAPLELVLADATRVPVVGELTIGRAPGVSLLLSDPSVSRVHARITADAVLEDAGSSHGTWLDGVRVTRPSQLRDGAKIRLGDAELRVERRRESTEAGPHDRRPAGRGRWRRSPPAQPATQFGMKPRVRTGYALKRLDASEGRQRWVLRRSRERDIPAALGQRRGRLPDARRVALAGRARRACPSSATGRPGRRGSRGC